MIGLFCVGNRAVNVVVSFICVVHTERFKLGFAACATGVLGFDKAPSLDTPPDGWHAFPALTFSAAPTSDACQLTTTTIEDEPPRSTDGSSLCDPGSSGVAFLHLCFALSFQRRGVSFAVTEHYPYHHRPTAADVSMTSSTSLQVTSNGVINSVVTSLCNGNAPLMTDPSSQFSKCVT